MKSERELQAQVEQEILERARAFKADPNSDLRKMLDGVAEKFDNGKTQLDLLPPLAVIGVGKVLTYGAVKYAAHNWRKGMRWSRLSAAALRHLFAWLGGEDVDPESGLPHLDHAACCLLFLSEFEKTKGGTDDRWKPTT